MATQVTSIEALLEETTVSQVVAPNQKVITIPHVATLSEAINVLSANRILSVIVEMKGETDFKKRYLGFIDMMDILGFLLKMYTENRDTENPHVHLHQWCQNIKDLTDRGRLFANHPVIDCIDLSKKDPFCIVSEDSKLPQLLYLFHQGPHRAAVLNKKNEVIGVVSQSNIISFLASNIHLPLGPTITTQLKDMNLGQKLKVFSVSSNSRAIHGFYQMWQNKVSAVAVVDDSGVLLGNLSISDLRGLTQEDFSSLLLPVVEFIKKRIPLHKIPPLCVKDTDTLEAVLLKLAATKLHRVWLVDEYGKPKGVVSLTDVMLLLDLRVYVREEDRTEGSV